MTKQRRNAPCDCGSGRKFKHCHGKIGTNDNENRPSEADLAELRRRKEGLDAAEHRRRLMHGLGRPIVSFEANGFRLVAVGNELRWSKTWATFADFLMAYLKEVLSPEWGNAELRKPTLDMHPVVRWFKHVVQTIQSAKLMDVNSRLRESQMDGTTRAFLGLAYDLFLCAHNIRTQQLLIKRLRHRGTFGGALYEANVIGWFIRAGFIIEFEDESDSQSTHCEFTAIHQITRKKFSVEAKSIGDDSRFAGNSDQNPRVRHKLIEGLKKKAEYARIIFIELNRAEQPSADAPPIWEQSLHEEIARCEDDVTIDGAPAPPAYVFMTNRGYLHRLHDTSWVEFVVVEGFKIPDFPIGKGCTTILQMHRARERNIEMYWLTRAMVNGVPVPQTFDGSAPEEAYAEIPIKRIRMGDLLEFDQNGETKIGKMVDAHVSEQERLVYATLEVDDQYGTITYPLTDVEMAVYRNSPDTFFDVVKPVNRPLTKPLEWFDFFAQSYTTAKRENLLEWMKQHPDIEMLRTKSQPELAEIYCDRLATSVWHRGSAEKRPK